jgi:hypothetical protein
MPSKEVITFWLDMTAPMTLLSPVSAVAFQLASHAPSSAAVRRATGALISIP